MGGGSTPAATEDPKLANRYLLDDLPPPGRAELSGDLAHHLGRVLRAQPGQQVRLGDGRGGTADATVVALARRTVTVDVGEPTHSPPTRPRVTLAFACPRPARADWLIEHATEVGVAAFQPLWCERSRPQSLRLERWRKIALAAVGQCDRAWAPELHEPVELGDWLDGELPERRLLASADGQRPPPASPDPAPDTALLVGPEGGFGEAEIDRSLAAGFAAICLGPHVLRTETAALVGAAILLSSPN